MEKLNRRKFLTAGVAATAAAPLLSFGKEAAASPEDEVNEMIANLSSITKDAKPISQDERLAKLEKLQKLMRAANYSAIFLEPSSTLVYFTGVHWGLSERLTAAIVPPEGEILFVTPFFEESRLMELVQVPASIRTWQEDESPFKLAADWIKELKLNTGSIALGAEVRHFVAHRLSAELGDVRFSSAVEEVNACRVIKSATELALMQHATNVTIAAYRAIYPHITKGMMRDNVVTLMSRAQVALGGTKPSGGAQIGTGSALPHGSKIPEAVDDGVVVLLDFGCTVHGYRSDISRTFVYGEATKEQRTVWEHVKRGQEVAFAAAQPGTPAGEVDQAVRTYYESVGYGPDYQLPGLSHRLGHGIGLDVHEPINFVRNETTPLASGMCFSNEPGIYFPGKFGVRLEDCLHITAEGPNWFSEPPESIDKPFT